MGYHVIQARYDGPQPVSVTAYSRTYDVAWRTRDFADSLKQNNRATRRGSSSFVEWSANHHIILLVLVLLLVC